MLKKPGQRAASGWKSQGRPARRGKFIIPSAPARSRFLGLSTLRHALTSDRLRTVQSIVAQRPLKVMRALLRDGRVRFVNLVLEDVIEVIRLSDKAHAEALHHRYCDFWLVDGELEDAAARKLLDELARSAGRTVERASAGTFLTPPVVQPGVDQRAVPVVPAVVACI
jgi:hypothetical protein